MVNPLVNQLARPPVVSPRERMTRSSMFRDPVGGRVGISLTGGEGPAAVGSGSEDWRMMTEQERGKTSPFTVTNVSQELIPADINRKFLFIQNNDLLGVVWVTFGGMQAVLGQGMRLAPGGGGILLDVNVPTSRIHVIGTVASNPNISYVSA